MMNIRICKALFMKDLKNCFVNKNVFLMLALPVLFGVMYKFLLGDILKGATGSFVIVMCIIMTISIVPLNVLANMVAEEKEKHTLRSLMLAFLFSWFVRSQWSILDISLSFMFYHL